MKGYVVAEGYMGYYEGSYVLFATEQDYAEQISEENADEQYRYYS